jgi:hypothetical protein
MKICSNAEQLRKALKTVKPSKIAVAFLGIGWKKYVSPSNLKEIILSPTLGSNPKAIEGIMQKIGIDNVYFLDNLHSKLYLGAKSALLGSANLSDNGFAEERLLEAGVVLIEPTNLKKLDTVFEDYKAKAAKLYATSESKQEKLRELMKQWQRSIWYDTNPEGDDENLPSNAPSIADYKSELDRIHINRYIYGDLHYNMEAIAAVIPGANERHLDESLPFLEEDAIEPGDWILCWRCKKDGSPHKNTNVSWMQVHYVIPKGVDYPDKNDPSARYTKLAIHLRDYKSITEPFALDTATNILIQEALSSKRFRKLRSSNSLASADAEVPKFLQHLREQYHSRGTTKKPASLARKRA